MMWHEPKQSSVFNKLAAFQLLMEGGEKQQAIRNKKKRKIEELLKRVSRSSQAEVACSIRGKMAPNTPDFDITLKQQTWELLKLLSFFLFLEESSRFENSLTSTAFSTQIHQEYDSEGEISSIPALMSQS